MSSRLSGRTAIVTGGSRGIGRACVLALAAEGADVAFIYHSSQQAADELIVEAKEAGHSIRALQADVRDGERAHEIVEQLDDAWGHIDILINSAGIVRDGLFASLEQSGWDDVIGTNLTGTFHYCHAVTRPMMSKRRGSIINISSVSAEFGNRGQVNYAASKGGIDGMTRCLAAELASRKVRVNAVAPGMIATDMSEAVRNLAPDRIKQAIPMRRVGEAEEIATVVTFLASDDASYLTGQVIRVDGGMSLCGA